MGISQKQEENAHIPHSYNQQQKEKCMIVTKYRDDNKRDPSQSEEI